MNDLFGIPVHIILNLVYAISSNISSSAITTVTGTGGYGGSGGGRNGSGGGGYES